MSPPWRLPACWAAVQAHLAFNLLTALLAWPVLGLLARLMERLLPDLIPAEDAGAARYLDAEALETPPVALAHAAREVLRLAVAVFMREDAEAARRLVREKEALRDAERDALRRMAEVADRTAAEGGAAAGLLLDAVRDLRRIGAHFAMVAHPLLERRGELLPSRLAAEGNAAESLAGA